MPINRSKLEQRLSACHKRLNDLFKEAHLLSFFKPEFKKPSSPGEPTQEIRRSLLPLPCYFA